MLTREASESGDCHVSFLKKLLENATIWVLFRRTLDLVFGIYKRRRKLLAEWDILGKNLSVLDIGCGTGQYSDITTGSYLGIDYNQEYIRRADSTKKPNQTFKTMDVADLAASKAQFDACLLVGITHHLDDNSVKQLLAHCKKVSSKYVIIMDPIQEQTNFVGSWFRDNDRGDYIRRSADQETLIRQSGLDIIACETLYIGPIRSIAFLCSPERKLDKKTGIKTETETAGASMISLGENSAVSSRRSPEPRA